MNDKQLFVRVRGKVTGPFGLQQLQSLRDRGQFRRFHEVSEDRKRWVSASTISELFPTAAQEGSPQGNEIPSVSPISEPPPQMPPGAYETASDLLPVPTQLSAYHVSHGPRHSMVGIFATVGAFVMLGVILAFLWICQDQADRISQTPGVNLLLAQQRFDMMKLVAKIIGISSVVTSLFWIAISFRSPNKKLWSIIGCAANLGLLLWILLSPLEIRVADMKYTPEQITENYRDRVYSIVADKSLGSGILLAHKGTRGLIATNVHVIDEDIERNPEKKILLDQIPKLKINVKNSTQLADREARIAAIHRRLDVALLVVELSSSEEPSGVRVMKQKRLKQGEAAVALGNPRGLEFFTSPRGISSTSGELGYIWHTCPLSSGNSGGPLILSRRGLLAGINRFASIDRPPGITQNLNAAIPAEEIILSLRSRQSDSWIWAHDLKELTFDLSQLVSIEE